MAPEAGTPPSSPPQRKRQKPIRPKNPGTRKKPGKPAEYKRIPRHLKRLQHRRDGTGDYVRTNQKWDYYKQLFEPHADIVASVLKQEGVDRNMFLEMAQLNSVSEMPFYARAMYTALDRNLGRVVDALLDQAGYKKPELYGYPAISQLAIYSATRRGNLLQTKHMDIARLTVATTIGDLPEIEQIIDDATSQTLTWRQAGHICKLSPDRTDQIVLILVEVLECGARAGRLLLVEYAIRELCSMDELTPYLCGHAIGAAIEYDHLDVLVFLLRFLSGGAREYTAADGSNADFTVTIRKGRMYVVQLINNVVVERIRTLGWVFSAHRDCLWWLLRQPWCHIHPEYYRRTETFTEFLWQIYNDSDPDPLPVWRTDPVLLDLRCRRLGNSACKLVAECMVGMEEREAFQIIDFSENPRIGPRGVRAIVRTLDRTAFHLREIRFSELPVCCLNTFRLLTQQRVYRIYETGLGNAWHKFLKHKTYPTLGMCVRGDFERAGRMKLPKGQDAELDRGCVANGVGVNMVCPFPSLVTIVSWWIANRIRKSKRSKKNIS